MSDYTIHSLHYYPVKGLSGHTVKSWPLAQKGFKYDRRWMFVDVAGNFMSQRKNPQFVHWSAAVEGEDLVFTDRRKPAVHYRITSAVAGGGTYTEVTLWNDQITANLEQSAELHPVLEAMAIPTARLVYMNDSVSRPIDQRYAKPGEEVSFADGYPYLITTTASLAALAKHCGENLAMSRFRPNIVLDTQEAWIEDKWTQIMIGGQPFRIPKPCARCKVVTINQETGEQRIELLAKIASLRKVNSKILFGVNAIWLGDDEVEIGVGDRAWVV